jgi:hypothetical protein
MEREIRQELIVCILIYKQSTHPFIFSLASKYNYIGKRLEMEHSQPKSGQDRVKANF